MKKFINTLQVNASLQRYMTTHPDLGQREKSNLLSSYFKIYFFVVPQKVLSRS